ncbi:hypothetical protein BH10PSE13_BH10PSE13_20800 [soil metagenome]
MPRFFIALTAGLVPVGSLMAVHAGAQPVSRASPIVTSTQDGKPILLKRMVVTATALPDAG